MLFFVSDHLHAYKLKPSTLQKIEELKNGMHYIEFDYNYQNLVS